METNETITFEKQQKIKENILKDFEENDYTIESPKLIVNPFGISPLAAVILFKTKEEESVTVNIDNGLKVMNIQLRFPKNTEHILPIYGLLIGKEIGIEIITSKNSKNKIFVKVTETIQNYNFPKINSAINKENNNFLIFMSPSTNNFPFAVDSSGNIRWFLTLNLNFDLHHLRNGNILTGSNKMIEDSDYTQSLYEITMLGELIAEYEVPGGYHHDTFELRNGDIVALANKENSKTVEDYMVLIDRQSGKLKKTWDFKSILPKNHCGSGSYSERDWCHANALDIVEDINEVWVSSRHLDIIFCFDYVTSELKYIIGDPEGWDEEIVLRYFMLPKDKNYIYQYEQHSVQIVNQDYVAFFDNGSYKSKNPSKYISNKQNYSRGRILRIDRKEKTYTQIFEYGRERGSEFFSPYISSFQYIDEGHYLVHSGGIATKNGETLEDLGIRHKNDPEVKLKSITVEIKNNKILNEIHTNDQIYRAKIKR